MDVPEDSLPPPVGSALTHLGKHAFGERLEVARYVLEANGLRVLLLRDDSAPVVSYQTWFRVGSSHERPGKTGQAHFFEHLMFNATSNHPQGEFDRLIEAAGGETNAATWIDWTYYHENVPASELAVVAQLEADRMRNLVLDEARVESEREVVSSERREAVEDDVGGFVNELLFATAFGREHPYGWPTIGWMEDIAGYTPDDCREFYRARYAPNNATLVIAGAIDVASTLALIEEHYGPIPKGPIALEPEIPRPSQRGERRQSVEWPTPTAKVAAAWHAPGFSSREHAVLTVLESVLSAGRSSRLFTELVREKELAAEVHMSLAPLRHASLLELWISAREGVSGDRCLKVVDKHIARLKRELVKEHELDKVKNRLELSFLEALETVHGKAQQVGFGETVVGDPSFAFERLEQLRRVTAEDVRSIANELLDDQQRTVIEVAPTVAPRKKRKAGARAKPPQKKAPQKKRAVAKTASSRRARAS